MKNVFKICLVLILALSMVFALVACGDEAETTTTTGGGNDNPSNPSGPSVPGDENPSGNQNPGDSIVDPLPEGDSVEDPAASDIFD